jgi:tetratricopeptide (TPR) repeat protein
MCLSAMAQIYEQRHDYIAAQALHGQCVVVARAALGPTNVEVALLLNRLGNFYFDRQEWNAALAIYQQGLQIEQAVCKTSSGGDDDIGQHPNLIVTLLNIGEIYKRQRVYGKARHCFGRALTLQVTVYGATSAPVASVLHTLGWMHDQEGDTHLALQYLQDALVMRRTVLGDVHEHVAASLASIGTILSRQDDMMSQALAVFGECQRIRIAVLGTNHRSVALATYNMGLCHFRLGNPEQAIACFLETLRVERLALGDSHRDVALTLYKLGESYKSCHEMDLALRYYTESLTMEQGLAKLDHLAMAQTWNEIGIVQLHLNQVHEAMHALSEAAREYQRVGRLVLAATISNDLHRTWRCVAFVSAAAA